jgi:hypothetical protein
MSYFDDASLVMIPSGYKDQKVYSVKPIDGSGDLTFTRSIDSATRVASNGLIEKVRTNLVLQSETFNTTWAVNGIVVTANTAANPLTGTTTADTITADAANNYHLIGQSITYAAGEATVSVYVKANGYTWFVIDPSITDAFAYYNITTGVVGTKGSACTTSITNVGGGWYRCSVTFTATAGAATLNFSIRNADNGDAFLGDGVSGFFIFGAQAETGVATDYIATTTAAVSVGPVANLPRLDYSGGATCPKILLEGQRTNLYTFSEQTDNAAWGKTNASITANDTASPDGYTNADKVIADTTNGVHRIEQDKATFAQVATQSVFAKASGYNFIALENGGELAYFNISTGVVGSVSGGDASIQDYGDGWYRCILTATAANTKSYVYIANADNSASFAGDNTSGAFIYGAQFEAGAYATSYIPTIAATTRGADSAYKTGISSLIGQTEGVLFLDFVATAQNADGAGFSLITAFGDANENFQLYAFGTTLYWYAWKTTVRIDETANQTLVAGQRYKIAYAYKSGDWALYINGVQKRTSAETNVPAVSQFNLSATGLGVSPVTAKNEYNQILLFPTRLSNSSLAELTA